MAEAAVRVWEAVPAALTLLAQGKCSSSNSSSKTVVSEAKPDQDNQAMQLVGDACAAFANLSGLPRAAWKKLVSDSKVGPRQSFSPVLHAIPQDCNSHVGSTYHGMQ